LKLAVIALCGTLCAAAAWAEIDVGTSVKYRLAVWPQRTRSPEFKLIDFDRRPRSLADYRGSVVVVLFGFTRCPEVCSAELFKLAAAMKQLGPVSEHVQVLFISLDPERDTPASLKSYVTAFDRRFIGLTGTAAQIDQAASSFFVQYARVAVGTDYTIDHSTGAYVLDTRGHLRLIGALDTSIDDFVHDLTALVKE
jgi:protein SCO1/2